MERDFMGLNSVKEPVVAVKDEVSGGVNDSALVKAHGSPWPYTTNSKVSAVPHFLSQICAQEDASNKTLSTGFSQNLVGNFLKPSPSAVSIAGLADSWNKSAGSPAQMTIFYNGTVKVYDSITPEKAQAIMFLAGNASCLVTKDARAGAQTRPPTPKFDAADVAVPVSQRVAGQPSSIISSPISVSSNNRAQSVSSSTSTDELVTNKPTLSPFSPDCKMDSPSKPITAFGSAAAPSLQRGIPQFRKVSLARFLEKRKERAMNAAPYNASKKPECAS